MSAPVTKVIMLGLERSRAVGYEKESILNRMDRKTRLKSGRYKNARSAIFLII